jgi:hypothetical protein
MFPGTNAAFMPTRMSLPHFGRFQPQKLGAADTANNRFDRY